LRGALGGRFTSHLRRLVCKGLPRPRFCWSSGNKNKKQKQKQKGKGFHGELWKKKKEIFLTSVLAYAN
jgi:hypothetical protein